jgi:hypothetical protein
MKINSKSLKIVIGVLGLPEPSNGSVTTQKPTPPWSAMERGQASISNPVAKTMQL